MQFYSSNSYTTLGLPQDQQGYRVEPIQEMITTSGTPMPILGPVVNVANNSFQVTQQNVKQFSGYDFSSLNDEDEALDADVNSALYGKILNK